MGSDAAVFPFNFARYQDRIVPAIKRYLLDGQTTGWLQTLINATHMTEQWHEEINGTDLERFCDYLDMNLAWNLSYDIADTWFDDWDYRSCKSTACPERFRCPYHQNGDTAIAEELNNLLQAAVTAFCVDETRFVGRSISVKAYWNVLTEFSVPEDDPLRYLLLKLGKRGFVIGYLWASSGEGIHGWLNPGETQELAHQLLSLPLPQVPASFEAMDQAIQAFREQPGDRLAFEALSLAFVRAVSIIATERQKGILWANDLINYPVYLPENLSLEG
jgi:hypothetical protein